MQSMSAISPHSIRHRFWIRQASNIAFFAAVVLVCFAPGAVAIVAGLALLLIGFVLSNEAA
jgi:hypothetical protein